MVSLTVWSFKIDTLQDRKLSNSMYFAFPCVSGVCSTEKIRELRGRSVQLSVGENFPGFEAEQSSARSHDHWQSILAAVVKVACALDFLEDGCGAPWN